MAWWPEAGLCLLEHLSELLEQAPMSQVLPAVRAEVSAGTVNS
jgi:hypothetical protein